MSTRPVLLIPDTHFPYHHKNCFTFLKNVYKEYRCKKVVQIGDMFDLHRTSRHLPEIDSMDLHTEVREAKKAVIRLSKLFPNMKICYGNHDVRAFRLAKSVGIGRMFMKTISEVFECPRTWEWKTEHIIDKVLYFHGDGYSGKNGALTAATDKRMSTVMGHLHGYAGIQYHNNGRTTIFGMNGGCLVDPKSPAFRYGALSRSKQVLGCGVIYSPEEAHFIPMT